MSRDALFYLHFLVFGVLSESMVHEVLFLAKRLLTNVALILKPEVDLLLGQLTCFPLFIVLLPHMLVEVLLLFEGALTMLTLVLRLL